MCEHCGKFLHLTRKAARQVKRRAHRGQQLSAYPCPVSPGWHLGHLPPGGRDVARRHRLGRAS
jgi:hypothetical protein